MSSFDDLPYDEQLRRLQKLAEHALGAYKLPDGVTATMINLSENATYRIDDPATGDRWALRVHREGYHSKTAIASELAWAKALRDEGAVITPTAIPGNDGEPIQSISHPDLPNPRHVVLFDWEEGHEPDEEQHDLRGPFEVLGEQTAHMHLHVRNWRRPSWFERHSWDFETSLGSTPHWGSCAVAWV